MARLLKVSITKRLEIDNNKIISVGDSGDKPFYY